MNGAPRQSIGRLALQLVVAAVVVCFGFSLYISHSCSSLGLVVASVPSQSLSLAAIRGLAGSLSGSCSAPAVSSHGRCRTNNDRSQRKAQPVPIAAFRVD